MEPGGRGTSWRIAAVSLWEEEPGNRRGAAERCFLPSIYGLGGQATGDEGEQRGGMPLSSQLGGLHCF